MSEPLVFEDRASRHTRANRFFADDSLFPAKQAGGLFKNETIPSDEYVSCMRHFAGAVNIITTADGNAWAGLTATAVCSLSAHPPRVLCCVNQKGVTMNVIRNTDNFCVNTLADCHASLAERFAGMGDIGGEDRFADGDWAPIKSGAPALNGALVSLDCVLETIVEYDSHAIIVGRVIASQRSTEKSPLLWFDSAFSTTQQIEKAS